MVACSMDLLRKAAVFLRKLEGGLNSVIELVDRIVARIMRPPITTGKQSPLAAIITVLRAHCLARRVCRDDVRVTLLVQRLELLAELVLVDHADDVSRHFGGIV